MKITISVRKKGGLFGLFGDRKLSSQELIDLGSELTGRISDACNVAFEYNCHDSASEVALFSRNPSASIDSSFVDGEILRRGYIIKDSKIETGYKLAGASR